MGWSDGSLSGFPGRAPNGNFRSIPTLARTTTFCVILTGRGRHFFAQLEIAYLGNQTRFYYNVDQTRMIENKPL
jgi:hypothetical protein